MFFEDDDNCESHNGYVQIATAFCNVRLGTDKILTLTIVGRVEDQDAGFDNTNVFIDNDRLVISATSKGDKGGCGSLNSPDYTPEFWDPILLEKGDHTIFIECNSNDEQFHSGAVYLFAFQFADPP